MDGQFCLLLNLITKMKLGQRIGLSVALCEIVIDFLCDVVIDYFVAKPR